MTWALRPARVCVWKVLRLILLDLSAPDGVRSSFAGTRRGERIG
jgi:hypothetical protein